MVILKELLYAKTHEWVKFTGDAEALVGLSDFAQHSLGDLVFINLPNVGDSVSKGEALGDVESVKGVSDVFSPLDGVVSEVNDDLLDSPQNINEDPYGAWLIKVGDVSGKGDLMNADEYEKYCEEVE